MRALVKINNKHIMVAWSKITKNGMVVGWSSCIFRREAEFGNSTSHDFHYFYPKDGNLHVSYKFVDQDGTKVERRHYWDHYSIKRMNPTSETVTFEKFGYIENDKMEWHSLANFKVPRLDTRPFFFDLPGIGINPEGDHSDLLQDVYPVVMPNADDLIIDLENSNGRHINIRCKIYDNSSPEFKSSYHIRENKPPGSSVVTSREENESIYLEMYVLYFDQ